MWNLPETFIKINFPLVWPKLWHSKSVFDLDYIIKMIWIESILTTRRKFHEELLATFLWDSQLEICVNIIFFLFWPKLWHLKSVLNINLITDMRWKTWILNYQKVFLWGQIWQNFTNFQYKHAIKSTFSYSNRTYDIESLFGTLNTSLFVMTIIIITLNRS